MSASSELQTGPLIYSYGACSTCRRALKWLADQGIRAQVIDITQTPPPAPVLQQALQSLGRARLLNTSGRSYRELGAQAVRAWSDDQLLAALAADGRLIRRPLLVTPAGSVLTGFKPQEWHDCLVGPG